MLTLLWQRLPGLQRLRALLVLHLAMARLNRPQQSGLESLPNTGTTPGDFQERSKSWGHYPPDARRNCRRMDNAATPFHKDQVSARRAIPLPKRDGSEPLRISGVAVAQS